MPLPRVSLQTLGATVLLAVALACGGKGGGDSTASTVVNITGTVTYSRVPLSTDANGVPTGLKDPSVAANLKSMPARGVTMRAYQQVEQSRPDGTKVQVWVVTRAAVTDSSGNYTLMVNKDLPTMVEVLSSFAGGDSIMINVVAEPGGINSDIPAPDRIRYALRKAADGTAPANNNIPRSVITSDAVVNFSVGLHDEWWLVNPSFSISNTEAPLIDQAVLETSLAGRTAGFGSGSRILGIGDTIATFVATYGAATPGRTFDLHYWPGRSEPRGSYVEYDTALFPQAYDASIGRFHYFGSLRGDDANDDAWDEGVIMPMLARNPACDVNAAAP